MTDRLENLARLIDVERAAEIEQNKLELSRFPASVREAMGKSVTRLIAEESDTMAGGYDVIKLARAPAGEELSPFYAMNRGDLVSLETPTGQRLDGTLEDVDEYDVMVALNAKAPSPMPGGRWTLHQVGSDATYKRMKRALEQAQSTVKGPVARLKKIFDGKTAPELEPGKPIEFKNGRLNEFQRKAVETALAAKDVALIHGPPGTGKTTVLVELILQAVERGQRVLASAPSNIAVDNLLEKLLPSGIRLVRLGHPARTLEALRHATLASQLHEHPDWKTIRDLDQARERLMKQRSRRSDRGQLSWDERKDRQREIQNLWAQARDLERTLAREVVDSAQVVLTTHGSIGRTLNRSNFELTVLDEASQATEPLSWLPILLSRKVVFAGDPLQLPPTLYSAEAAKQGLELTLFERLMAVAPQSLRCLLRVQYRMNEVIMRFPSRRFYKSALIADASVKRHLARELPGAKATDLTSTPLIFVDTAGTGFQESWDEALQSRENVDEAALVARLAKELLQAGLEGRTIALLSPYVAQVKRLRSKSPDPDIEIGTVDGFQGREKEAVLISLVRSNDQGEVGFLEDSRRINVAITRARRLLIVVGDSATVAQHELFSSFVEYAEKSGVRRSAWDWLNQPS